MFGADLLLTLLKKYWLYIVVAVAVAAWHAAVFYAGGVGPRATLDKERAEHAAQVAQLKAEAAADRAASAALIERKDGEHEANIGKINADWNEFLDRLCPGGVYGKLCVGPNGHPLEEPVRIRAKVCDDEASNNRLSDALQGYRREVDRVVKAERDQRDRILSEERRGAGELLKQCQVQTDALINLQDVWLEERGINAAPAAADDLIPGKIQ